MTELWNMHGVFKRVFGDSMFARLCADVLDSLQHTNLSGCGKYRKKTKSFTGKTTWTNQGNINKMWISGVILFSSLLHVMSHLKIRGPTPMKVVFLVFLACFCNIFDHDGGQIFKKS